MADTQAQLPETPPPLDEERLHERARRSYSRNFWGAYKGHVPGMLTGAIIGSVLAAGIGAALFGAVVSLPVFAAIAVGAKALGIGAFTAAFSAFGAALGAHGFGAVGSAAHVRATSLAEKHARDWIREPGFEKGQDKFHDMPFYEGLYGHHYEIPPTRDKRKWFHWKTALVGGAICAGVAALTFTGIGLAGFAAMEVLGIKSLAVAGIAGGLFGATYGIDRDKFRSTFNITDAWPGGGLKVKTESSFPPALDKSLSPGECNAQQEAQTHLIARQTARQKLIYTLENKYDDLIFWGAISGRFKGFVGGPALGAVVGAVVGAGVLAATAAFGIPLLGASVTALGVTMAFSGMGALLGIDIFSNAGTEAGAESMAKAIDEEHSRNLKLIREGKQPQYDIVKSDKSLFNWKAAAICGAAGAAIGIPLGGFVGAGAFGLLHAGIEVSATAAAAASSIIGGLVGITYGIKARHLKAVSRMTNNLYHGKVFGANGTEHAHEHVLMDESTVRTTLTPSVTPEDLQKINIKLGGAAAAPFTQRVQPPVLVPGVMR